MNNFTEHTWTIPAFAGAIKDLMKTYAQYPPRKAQSEAYSGPVTLSQYEWFQYIRESLQKNGFNILMPGGN